MKNRLVFLSLVMLNYGVSAQETFQTVTTNGNTTTQHIKIFNGLDVGDHYDPAKYGVLQIARPSNQGNNFHLSFVRAGQMVYGMGFLINSNVFALQPGGSIATSSGFFMDTQGNVGVGTSVPAEKLHVNGGQSLNGNLTFVSDQTAYFIKGSGNGGAIRIRSNAIEDVDRNIQLGNVDNNGNWNGHMTVASTGNVGIGTTTPDYSLHLRKQQPTINFEKTGVLNWTIGNLSGNDFYIRADNGTQNPFVIASGTGNLGIGTTTPNEKLAVNGKIRAKEVKVEMANWPDYVFETDYKQKSLSELETFIKQNKHLPEVPSAKEVEKNGVELGEMNKILLKKIEELTLLLIEQNKRIERLEKSK